MDRAAQVSAGEVARLRGEIDMLRLRLGRDTADLRIEVWTVAIWMAVALRTVIILGAMVALVRLVKP